MDGEGPNGDASADVYESGDELVSAPSYPGLVVQLKSNAGLRTLLFCSHNLNLEICIPFLRKFPAAHQFKIISASKAGMASAKLILAANRGRRRSLFGNVKIRNISPFARDVLRRGINLGRPQIKDKEIKILWGLAAARCSYPDCRRPLVLEKTDKDPAATIGEMAHIIAFSRDKGPRSDPSFQADLRDTHENLILLCDTHHSMVDKQPNTFTCSDLRHWKLQHETWVAIRLKEEMTNVNFTELEMVANALLAGDQTASNSFALTPPREKMDRNELNQTRGLVMLGLANAKVVERFVQSFSAIQPNYVEQLKAGFLVEYNRRFLDGLRGDALFEAMREFSSSGSPSFLRQAAGLSVLVYLFEKCEVFTP
jgi:hypothetical protein